MKLMISAILLMTLATILTRALPFMIFSRIAPPKKLVQSARLIPGAVMVVLVFTSLPSIFVSSDVLIDAATWLPWLSVVLVAVLHIWTRHPLVSIAGGTAFYMLLLHILT